MHKENESRGKQTIHVVYKVNSFHVYLYLAKKDGCGFGFKCKCGAAT